MLDDHQKIRLVITRTISSILTRSNSAIISGFRGLIFGAQCIRAHIQTVIIHAVIFVFVMTSSPGIAQAFIDAQLQIGSTNQVKITSSSESMKDLQDQTFKGLFLSLSVHGSPPIPTPFFDIGFGLTGSYDSYNLADRILYGYGVSSQSGMMSASVCEGLLCVDQVVSWERLINQFQATAQSKSHVMRGSAHSLKGFTIGPQVQVSGSIPGISAGPTARLSYVLGWSQLHGSFSVNNTAVAFAIPMISKGWRYALGAHFSPFPLVSFFVEYEWSDHNFGLSSAVQALSAKQKTTLYKVSEQFHVAALDFKLNRGSLLAGVKVGL